MLSLWWAGSGCALALLCQIPAPPPTVTSVGSLVEVRCQQGFVLVLELSECPGACSHCVGRGLWAQHCVFIFPGWSRVALAPWARAPSLFAQMCICWYSVQRSVVQELGAKVRAGSSFPGANLPASPSPASLILSQLPLQQHPPPLAG